MTRICLLAVFSALFFPLGLYGQGADTNKNSFSKKEISVYNTKESFKSEGINLTVEYPSDWVSKPGSSENSVRKFTNKNPKSLTVFVIVIRNLEEGKNLDSKSKVKKDLNDMRFERMIPPKAELISGEYTKIDTFPFAFTRAFSSITRGNSNTKLFGDSYMTAFNRKVITLQFYTFASPRTSNKELHGIHKELSRTYKKVAHNINIQNTF